MKAVTNFWAYLSKLIVGLCTGSFWMAKAGLLHDKSCAVHPNVLRAFVDQHPNTRVVTQKSYWMEDNLITCPGGILSLDVAGHIIRTCSTPSRTFKAFDYLLFNYENPRSFIPKRSYQERLDQASNLTRDAVGMMEANIDRPFSVGQLADRLSTTRTRLTRNFAQDMGAPPGTFWLRMRLEMASRLLLERNLTVTQVSYELGFSDAAHFCRQFKEQFKLTPRKYRTLYHAAAPEKG